ncbi:hypothetical protein RHD99_09765 [Buttiauxella selenatireducens]|uniref:Antimicrobial protein n=1 Tax=Buttiauxella selenatireducens TaxID=3073902 RepID=A0ABY9SFA0_9ENTR|nr:hypothetical protein [Buttiauxella sp. R73]WMY76188.1 hypothetical protein RHD99_09765 [Buttiauxella sp. R73]
MKKIFLTALVSSVMFGAMVSGSANAGPVGFDDYAKPGKPVYGAWKIDPVGTTEWSIMCVRKIYYYGGKIVRQSKQKNFASKC